MSEQKLGIENLKQGVKLVIDFSEEVERASKTKNKLVAITGFFDELFAVPAVAQKFPQIIEEAKDVDRDEHRELVDYIRQECSLENEAAEVVVEDALEWLSLTYRLGKNIANLKKAS